VNKKFEVDILSASNFTSFGFCMNGRKFSTPSYRYAFQGMEKNSEWNEGSYDFGARMYDGRIGRWLAIDPKVRKYPMFSPYCAMINNPINVIDPDGRDIIVLSHGSRSATSVDGGKTNAHAHLVGHMAVLIGNDKTGWTYLSYDFDEGTNKGRGKSGANDVYTETTFKTLADFKNSEHNTFKDDYDDGQGTKTSHKDADGNIIQRYENAFQIAATAEKDAEMLKAASAVFDTPWTQVESIGQANNCTTVAEKALNAGGFKNGEMTPYIQTDAVEIGTRNFLPAAKQEGIEKRNTGTDVDKKIERSTGGAGGDW